MLSCGWGGGNLHHIPNHLFSSYCYNCTNAFSIFYRANFTTWLRTTIKSSTCRPTPSSFTAVNRQLQSEFHHVIADYHQKFYLSAYSFKLHSLEQLAADSLLTKILPLPPPGKPRQVRIQKATVGFRLHSARLRSLEGQLILTATHTHTQKRRTHRHAYKS